MGWQQPSQLQMPLVFDVSIWLLNLSYRCRCFWMEWQCSRLSFTEVLFVFAKMWMHTHVHQEKTVEIYRVCPHNGTLLQIIRRLSVWSSVKTLFKISASHMGVPGFITLFWLLTPARGSSYGPSSWVYGTHVGGLDWVLGSQLCPRLVPGIEDIWGMNQFSLPFK